MVQLSTAVYLLGGLWGKSGPPAELVVAPGPSGVHVGDTFKMLMLTQAASRRWPENEVLLCANVILLLTEEAFVPRRRRICLLNRQLVF